MAQLNADPKYVAMRARKDRELAEREAELSRAEQPLLAELRQAGVEAGSVWGLVNASVPYPAVIPVLIEHLPRPYPSAIREGIARALGVRDAKPHWSTLAKLFHAESDPRVRDGIAAALSAIADRSLIDELIALVQDRRGGPSRILLISALTRSRQPRAREALVACADDPDLEKEVRVVLQRIARRKARKSASRLPRMGGGRRTS